MNAMKVFDKNLYKDRQIIGSLRVKIFLKKEDLVKKKAWNLNNFEAAGGYMKRNLTLR
jgi:tryptophan synthase beta subunit